MSVALLDVNVLIALFDPEHVHHQAAHKWFERNRMGGWATCPITMNGCIRILSNRNYRNFDVSVAATIEAVGRFCEDTHHVFWPDQVRLTDTALFRTALIPGPKNTTDVYLLGLATHNHGRLATFDGSIPLKAVVGATQANLGWILG